MNNSKDCLTIHSPPDRPEAVGTLKMGDDGRLTFEGDADESARLFFDSVVKLNNEHITALEAAVKEHG